MASPLLLSLLRQTGMDADCEAECIQYFLQLHAIANEGFQNDATGSVTVDIAFRRARMLKLQVRCPLSGNVTPSGGKWALSLQADDEGRNNALSQRRYVYLFRLVR